MCTNFVLINKTGTAQLAARLKVDNRQLLYGNNFTPGSRISIIVGSGKSPVIRHAIWWLYLQQTPGGLKPHKTYFSVNTNYNRLADKPEYRTSRCIIPATAFVESQDGRHPHLLEPEDGSAIAFGGLYKEWTDRHSGEIVTSASIITLAGHPALERIHRKSTPLWLPERAYDDWLAPGVTDTARFAPLLIPTLHTRLKATPIDKTFAKRAIGASFSI